jgi:hypothetical protein
MAGQSAGCLLVKVPILSMCNPTMAVSLSSTAIILTEMIITKVTLLGVAVGL